MIDKTIIYNNEKIMNDFRNEYRNYHVKIDKCDFKYNVKIYKDNNIIHNILCDNIKLLHFKETGIIHVYLYKMGYDSYTTYEKHIETFYVLSENIETKCYINEIIYNDW